MQQVITIDADGQISGLQRKRGQGLDLRQFGDAEIVRASEIIFNSEDQMWEIKFMVGTLAGRFLTHVLYAMILGTAVRFKAARPVMQFDDYDDAVKVEIAVLDAIRRGVAAPKLTADDLKAVA